MITRRIDLWHTTNGEVPLHLFIGISLEELNAYYREIDKNVKSPN